MLQALFVWSSLEDAEQPHNPHFSENCSGDSGVMSFGVALAKELPLATLHFLLSTENRRSKIENQIKKNETNNDENLERLP